MARRVWLITNNIPGGEAIATRALIKYLRRDPRLKLSITTIRHAPVATRQFSLWRDLVDEMRQSWKCREQIGRNQHSILYATRLVPLAVIAIHPKTWRLPKIYHFHGFSHQSLKGISHLFRATSNLGGASGDSLDVARGKPDNVQSACPELAERTGPKVNVMHLMLIPYLFTHAIIRYMVEWIAIRSTSAIIAPTPESACAINAHYGISGKHIHVIPNGVDHHAFHPDNVAQSHQLLFVGRFSQEKNIELLVKLADQLPEYRLRLVVQTTDQQDKKTIAHIVKQHKNISVVTNCSPKRLAKEYQESMLLLLPSFTEQQPLCYLESIACGTPVITPPIPSLLPLQKQIDQALAASNWSVEAFVQAIEHYAALSPHQRRDIAQRCLKLSKQYTWETSAAKISSLFHAP